MSEREAALTIVAGHLAALRDDARAMEATADLFGPEFDACWVREPDGRLGEMLAPERALQLRPLVITNRDLARANRQLADAIETLIAPCDGSGEAGETEGLDPKGNSAVDEASSKVEAPAPQDLKALQAENERLKAQRNTILAEKNTLSTALAESERKAITLEDIRGSMWRLQYARRVGDDLWPAILKARDARLASTPTQEAADGR